MERKMTHVKDDERLGDLQMMQLGERSTMDSRRFGLSGVWVQALTVRWVRGQREGGVS